MEGFQETDVSDYEYGAEYNGLILEHAKEGDNDCLVEKTISIFFCTLAAILTSKFKCVCLNKN